MVHAANGVSGTANEVLYPCVVFSREGRFEPEASRVTTRCEGVASADPGRAGITVARMEALLYHPNANDCIPRASLALAMLNESTSR